MRPLTDTTPKPLLPVQGKPLMQWHLEALARAGVRRVVVNTAWLGAQIVVFCGLVGPALALDIAHSPEGQDFGMALETAGGVARALPLLFAAATGDVFGVLAGDVFIPDFVFSPAAVARFMASDKLAHLWLVPNPPHNPQGDFGLSATNADGVGLALSLPPQDPQPRHTFSTIALYRRALFAPPWCDIPPGNPHGTKAALAPLLRRAMRQGQVSAEIYTGRWVDVGTPERLAQLNTVSPSPF